MAAFFLGVVCGGVIIFLLKRRISPSVKKIIEHEQSKKKLDR